MSDWLFELLRFIAIAPVPIILCILEITKGKPITSYLRRKWSVLENWWFARYLVTPYLDARLKSLYDFYGEEKPPIVDGNNRYPYEIVSQFYGVDTKSISFNTQLIEEEIDTPFLISPTLKERSGLAIAKLRKIGKLTHDEEAVRVSNLSWDGRQLKVVVQKAMYSDQVGTNLTLDWEDGRIGSTAQKISLRVYDAKFNPEKEVYKYKDFKESCLANTIGVSTIIMCSSDKTSDEGAYVFQRRKGRVAVASKMMGPTASGVMNWPSFADGLPAAIIKEMAREIAEEDELKRGHFQIIPLAFCREHARGGKPEFFFLARTSYTFEELKTRIKSSEAWKIEHDRVVQKRAKEVFERYGKYSHAALVNVYFAEDFLNWCVRIEDCMKELNLSTHEVKANLWKLVAILPSLGRNTNTDLCAVVSEVLANLRIERY